jgi:hypothetical protein
MADLALFKTLVPKFGLPSILGNVGFGLWGVLGVIAGPDAAE